MTDERSTDGPQDTDASSSEGGLEELAKRLRSQTDSQPRDDATDIEFDPIPADSRDSEDSADSLRRLTEDIRNESNDQPLRIESGADVLVLESPASTESYNCLTQFSTTDSLRENVFVLAITKSAERRLAAWETEREQSPPNMCVVTFGNRARSSEGSTALAAQPDASTITTEHLGDPSDLTRLGILISRRLADWQHNQYPTHVCCDSLTQLLQYIDPQRLFRFLHMLQSKFDPYDVTSHYHMNVEAHDEQVINTFRPLFDDVLHRSADGTFRSADE